jgi:cell division transport system permease protein
MSLVSIGTITFSFLVFGAFLIVTLNLYGLAQRVKERMSIEVYFDDSISKPEAIRVKRAIEGFDGVKRVVYIDKEEAALDFSRNFGKEFMEAVPWNPLPASLRIEVEETHRSLSRMEGIVDRIDEFKGVDEINYGRNWVSKLSKLILVSGVADICVGVLITLASIFVVSNTIKLTILARREIIEIMSLVGATDGFIRRPFVLEGVIQGLIGGAISATVLWGMYVVVSDRFPDLIFILPYIRSNMGFWIFSFSLASGALLGAAGSHISFNQVFWGSEEWT